MPVDSVCFTFKQSVNTVLCVGVILEKKCWFQKGEFHFIRQDLGWGFDAKCMHYRKQNNYLVDIE